MPGELAAGIARLVSLLPPEGRRDLRRLLAHELAAPAPELERGARLDLLCDLIEWAGGEVPTVENYEDERSRRGGLAPPSAATLSSLRRLDQRGGRRRLARGGRIRWTAGERAPRVPASIFTRGGPTHPGVLPRRARLVADTVGVRGVGTTPAPSPAALSRGSRKDSWPLGVRATLRWPHGSRCRSQQQATLNPPNSPAPAFTRKGSIRVAAPLLAEKSCLRRSPS